MLEELKKVGLYVDDIYRLRVQDPRIASERNELREESLEYGLKLQEFKKIVNNFHKVIGDICKDVESEKIRTIGIQNQLKTIAKRRQVEQQKFQSQIVEKTTELDRLKTGYQYMQRIESEQQEIINNLLQNQ